MSLHKTFCRHCTSLCGLEVEVVENRAISIRGDRESPISEGYSCMMGQHNMHVQDTADRLRSAQKRTLEGELTDIDTSVALQEIAAKLDDLRQRWGPRSIALYYGTGTAYSGLAYGMAKTFLGAIGSPEHYTSLTVDQSAKWVTALRMGNFATGKPSYRDLDCMMLIGLNPVISHQGVMNSLECSNPLKHLNAARKRGCKIIVVDPRRTETAQRADLHLQVHPGEDATLMAALIREVLANGWQDEAFCTRFVNGVETLRELVASFDLEYVSRRTGVPAEKIVAAARMLGTARRRSVGSGTGSNMSRRSNLNDHMAEALNAICGGYRKAGEPIRDRGGLFAAIPNTETVVPPAYTWKDEPRLRSVDCGLIGTEFPTSRLPDEILHPGEDRIRALISFGGNPATAIGGQAKTIRALQSLELLVSIDPRISETGRYAHYIVPTKLPLERMDLTTTQDNWFSGNLVRFTEPLLTPPPGVIEDWEVFYELARHMKLHLDYRTGPFGSTLPQRVPLDMVTKPTTEEMFRITVDMTRVTMEELRAHPEGLLLPSDEIVNPAPFDDGARLELCPPEIVDELREVRAERPATDPHHPYLLISRRIKRVMNTAYHNLEGVRKQHEIAPLCMHPDDVATEALADGLIVSISSEVGRIIGKLHVDDTLARGVVSMPMGWGSSDPAANATSLTAALVSIDDYVEPINFMPRFSGVPVRVTSAVAQPMAH